MPVDFLNTEEHLFYGFSSKIMEISQDFPHENGEGLILFEDHYSLIKPSSLWE